jgi:hypothetical protein
MRSEYHKPHWLFCTASWRKKKEIKIQVANRKRRGTRRQSEGEENAKRRRREREEKGTLLTTPTYGYAQL